MKGNAVLNLTKAKARDFFFESESYCNIDLPEYFDFKKFLEDIGKFNNGFDIKSAQNDVTSHIIYNNKDGKYAWRKLELIHPVLYIELTNKLTDNWEEVRDHFKNSYVDKIRPCQIYIRQGKHKKQKKTQILSYLESIEKESIKKSLGFKYMSKLDIANCYPSVYTHAVSWALHTKAIAKNNRKNSYNKNRGRKDQAPLLGNDIDYLLQAMQSGQTNGIPQGSILMDFIAEIVLTHIDKLLGDKLEDEKITEYNILRYRDDYRIFTNEKNENEKIIKFLSEILIEFNFRLNTSKTEVGEDVVLMSIKKDKLDNIIYHFGKDQEVDVFRLKRLLLDVLNISKTYPNSGFILKTLQYFNERGFYKKSKRWYAKEADLLITILINIAVNNPRSFAVVCIGVFNLLAKLDEDQKKYFSDTIYKNLLNIHNIGYNEIWLQRSLYKVDRTKKYQDKICKVVSGSVKTSIFGNHFISDSKLKSLLNRNNFIKRSKLSKMSKIPTADEVDIFDSVSG